MGEWHMCHKCMRGCKIAYMVGRTPHCATCMKSSKTKDMKMFLIAKYERHLNNLTPEQLKIILERHKDREEA